MTVRLPMLKDAPEPVLFEGGTIDRLVGMVFTLGMEVSVLAAKVRELEAAAGGEIDQEVLAAQFDADQDGLLDRLMANLRPDASHARPLVGQVLRKSAS